MVPIYFLIHQIKIDGVSTASAVCLSNDPISDLANRKLKILGYGLTLKSIFQYLFIDAIFCTDNELRNEGTLHFDYERILSQKDCVSK